MPKFRVKNDFYRGRLHLVGEIYHPETQREEDHLIRTGQIEVVTEKKKRKVTEKVKAETLEDLQAKYEEISGKKPHHLWKESRIKDEITKL